MSANNCGQRLTVRSASGCNPWQPRSRPVLSPAVHLPQYNGFRGTVATPRFTSRQTPFSCNDSPPMTVRSQSRPATMSVVSGKVNDVAFYIACLCLYRNYVNWTIVTAQGCVCRLCDLNNGLAVQFQWRKCALEVSCTWDLLYKSTSLPFFYWLHNHHTSCYCLSSIDTWKLL